jgi:hypothetical protein
MCGGSSGGVRKRCTTFKDVLLINDSSPISHQKQGTRGGGYLRRKPVGADLPEEVLVRDKRYTVEEITQLCYHAGLEVIWSGFVSSEKWEAPQAPVTDDHTLSRMLSV